VFEESCKYLFFHEPFPSAPARLLVSGRLRSDKVVSGGGKTARILGVSGREPCFRNNQLIPPMAAAILLKGDDLCVNIKCSFEPWWSR
jgi:hypothetical protein